VLPNNNHDTVTLLTMAEQMQTRHSLSMKWATLEHRHEYGNFSANTIRTSWKHQAKWRVQFLHINCEEIWNVFKSGAKVPSKFGSAVRCDACLANPVSN